MAGARASSSRRLVGLMQRIFCAPKRQHATMEAPDSQEAMRGTDFVEYNPNFRARGDRLMYSNYFVTVNSNVVHRGNEAQLQRIGDRILQGIRDMCGTAEFRRVYTNMLRPSNKPWVQREQAKMGPPSAKALATRQASGPLRISQVKFGGRVEVGHGRRGGRIHYHGVLKIQHNGVLRVFKEDYRRELVRIMGLPVDGMKNLYVKLVWFKSNQPIHDYITKDDTLKENFKLLQRAGMVPEQNNRVVAEDQDDDDDDLGGITRRMGGLDLG